MKSTAAAGVSLFIVFASLTHAEESSIVGRYTGTFAGASRQRAQVPIGLTLTIHKATDGSIEATGEMYPFEGVCKGPFPMIGTVKGNELRLRNAKPFGQTGDCNFSLRLTMDGSQLVGTTYLGRPVQLSK
jgi:hypothetical protein